MNTLRVLIIDAQTAWVREQHVYDNAGALTASVVADNFRYDAATHTSLPERVRVNVPAAGLDLTINTGQVVINAPVGDGGQLWSLPQLGSYPVVDLTAPGGIQGATKGPWDLAGTGSVYGQPGSLVESYASTPPMAPQPTTPIAAQPVPSVQPPSSYLPQATLPQTTAQVTPVTLPQQSGFVGLPAGGRALE